MFNRDNGSGYEQLLNEETEKRTKKKGFWKRLLQREKNTKNNLGMPGHPFVFRTRKNPDFIVKGRLERVTLDPAVTQCKPEDVGKILEILRFTDRSVHSWESEIQESQTVRIKLPENWTKRQMTRHLDMLFKSNIIIEYEIKGIGSSWVDIEVNTITKQGFSRPIYGL